MFDTLMVFMKDFFQKVDFEKNQQTTKKHEKLVTHKFVVIFLPRHVKFLNKKCGTTRRKYVIFLKIRFKCFFAFPMSMDVVNPAVRDTEMLTANLAVRLLLAPVAGHNPVKRSCIFCIKI